MSKSESDKGMRHLELRFQNVLESVHQSMCKLITEAVHGGRLHVACLGVSTLQMRHEEQPSR